MQTGIDYIKADVADIKEHAKITKGTVNNIGEWTEIASEVLKINYPVKG